MSVAAAAADPVSELRVFLAGNPNAGKTTLFNTLTGANARVGNFPGVTVERRTGRGEFGGVQWEISDLPGCYSLHANSADERVALEALTGVHGVIPDAVVVVLDANCLARNLLLLLEIQALGLPVVGALNLVGDAQARGVTVDAERLAAELSCPIVPLEAPSADGITALAEATKKVARPTSQTTAVDVGRTATTSRYARIDAIVQTCVAQREAVARTGTERFDQLALHPIVGGAFFIVVLGLLFQGVFAWSDPAIDAVDTLGGAVADFLRSVIPGELFAGVVVDGIWAGVVGTLVFLPQICVLFIGIELLEDSGYLARAVVLADRLMRAAGLPGRAFVPLLSSLACNVPGIMAARTIPSASERMATIMVAPLMTCSARLPVYTMVTAAVLAGSAPVLGIFSLGGLVITGMYLFGIVLALLAALVLRKSLLRGESRPLMLELPVYRWPRVRNVAIRVWQRVRIFVVHTGSVIVALTVVLWVLMTFPRLDETANQVHEKPAVSALSEQGQQRRQLEQSYAGQIGKFVEPAIAPLGFDWRIGIGLVGSFAAREVLIPVMAQVYGKGADDSDETTAEVGQSLVKISGMSPLVGISLMVFFAIAMQCLSTVAVIADETRSWKWPVFAVVYLNTLAWLASFLVYQVGTALGYA